jgi:glycosyltransferase involved in cell wall biosynthesis
MNKSRVIHLITTIERGGAEKQLLILTQEQVLQGLDVEVFYLKGQPELQFEFEKFGVKVNQSLVNKNFMKQNIIFRKIIRSSGVVVHAHLPKSELITALTCRKNGFVVTRHNSEAFWPGIPKFISSFLSKFVTKNSAHVICISEAVKNYIKNRGEVSKSSQISTVHYGYDKNYQINSSTQNEFSSIFKPFRSSLKIGTIGRLVDQKDYPTLFSACKNALSKGVELELFIIGEGKLRKELEVRVESLLITERVHWLGKTADINDYLCELDLFILPSQYEGFGLVLLEAMQAVKPILASNNSSIPEVLGSSYEGLFKTSDVGELSELIMKIQKDSSFPTRLVQTYSDRLALFAPSNMSGKISHIYKNMGFI